MLLSENWDMMNIWLKSYISNSVSVFTINGIKLEKKSNLLLNRCILHHVLHTPIVNYCIVDHCCWTGLLLPELPELRVSSFVFFLCSWLCLCLCLCLCFFFLSFFFFACKTWSRLKQMQND